MTEARDVARAAVLWAWSFRRGMVDSGFNRGVTEHRAPTATEHGGNPLTVAMIADRLTTMPTGSTMPTVPLFVELCAGTAALSLALHGGRHARPPVSRMGSKSGYAAVILSVLGLRPGEGAARYLWCEPDAGCRLMLTAYTDAALRREAAAIIRSWADEEPRALWTRLRDEGPVRCPPVDPREVARWGWLAARSRKADPAAGFQVAHTPTQEGGNNYGPTTPADRLDALPSLPAVITDDARAVDPREVARSIMLDKWSFSEKGASKGYGGPGASDGGTWGQAKRDAAIGITATTAKIEALPSLPAVITDDARPLEPADLPPGTIAYLDPSYVGTTGYADNLPRADVVALARRWAAAGAWVVISEAEPIADLVADGWHAVEITAGRVGQKRTFSRQQREWLTLSRPPAWRPSEQAAMFGDVG